MSATLLERAAHAREVAAATPDPELPFLTVADLGILRAARVEGDTVIVTVTPTYSGCPAMREIMQDVRARLLGAGLGPVDVRVALQPPWTTEWITPEGRRKLAAAGIAPPSGSARTAGPIPLTLGRPARTVACPRCGSSDTALQAPFSGTACKALYRCAACAEPFEHLKEI